MLEHGKLQIAQHIRSCKIALDLPPPTQLVLQDGLYMDILALKSLALKLKAGMQLFLTALVTRVSLAQ
jgi:hypothetical protein